PNRVVLSMYQDRHGRLWLVMDRGVVIRVSETTAHVFDVTDGFAYLRGTAVAEDDDDGVWFVSGNEVCRIRENKVEHFGEKDGLPTGGHICLATDAQGQLWFACGSHVGIFRAGRWQTLLTLESSPVHLAAARSGDMWICTATRVVKYAAGGEPKEIVKLPGHMTVQVMLEDHTGGLWIGTVVDGLLFVKGNELERVAVSHPEITALTEDREGNLWIGTAGGGLNLLRPKAMDLLGTKAGLPFESVRSVCQDTDGWVWAALQNGSLARGRGSEWKAVSNADGWPGGNASCVAPDLEGGVWIGTRDRGLQQWQTGKFQEWGQREGLGGEYVRSLLQATNGDLWIATDSPSRLWLFQGAKFHELQLPAKVRGIRAIAEGVGGIIWAGTSDGQILRIQGRTVTNELAAQKGPPFSVRCLNTTADGSLWIGYAGWGIGRWHAGVYSRISTAQGLYDDYVSQMLSDDHGGLWVAGNHGLFQMRLAELDDVTEGRSTHLRANVYGRDEGLPSLQPVYENSPTAWRSTGGQLWFSTRNGILAVQPDKIRENPIPPTVFVSEVKLDDRPVALYDSHFPLRAPGEAKLMDLHAPGDGLRLPPQHTKIEFAFSALSFNSPENVQFRYRLTGFDSEWTEAGTQRSAKYPHLSAGPYEFEVTACNEAGVWSQTGFHLPFTVQPFYWQTWWFRLGALVVFTAGVIGVVRYVSFRRLRRELDYLERQSELQKERTRIARDMHDEVGSKLSRLSLLSEMASHKAELPSAARSEAAEISETARDTIRSFEEIVWAVNPKNDTLPNLLHYLCRFAEDFFEGGDVQCAFDLPEKIPEAELPTELRHHIFLAAKEAINNVFKHAHARQAWVRVKITDAGFDIEIEDDGQGFAGYEPARRAGTGNGLENMRDRMRLAGGRLEIQTGPGKGTRVTLHVTCPQINFA
ncbi:MAG TPA: two-component regulator propeller domain-containing protein, partial [Verrucomicrobiae bacterium]|nr:two-component regulator propeller domain-containing protein [Verrucomicrobiae bacterium]